MGMFLLVLSSFEIHPHYVLVEYRNFTHLTRVTVCKIWHMCETNPGFMPSSVESLTLAASCRGGPRPVSSAPGSRQSSPPRDPPDCWRIAPCELTGYPGCPHCLQHWQRVRAEQWSLPWYHAWSFSVLVLCAPNISTLSSMVRRLVKSSGIRSEYTVLLEVGTQCMGNDPRLIKVVFSFSSPIVYTKDPDD